MSESPLHSKDADTYAFSIPAVVGITILIFFLLRRVLVHRLPLPPGPRGYPLIGNVLDMRVERPWLTYFQWGKQFGDVVHISALGQSIVILNSAKAISDLLDRRSAVYSDRPRMVMAGELVGYADSPIMISSGPRHREFRRLFSEVLNPRKVEEWRPLQEQKVEVLVKGFMEAPEAFREHIRRYVASLVFEISHGHNLKAQDDPLIRMAEEVDRDWSQLIIPGAYAVLDVFPFLQHVPEWAGFTFKKQARNYKKRLDESIDWPYQQVKDQIAAGTARPSFTASLIERKQNPTQEDDFTFKWTSGIFYTAGADTSVSSLASFILAMALNPAVQRKAQAEIDRILILDGSHSERRPTFQDRRDLPYVECLIKEVYRWNPVGPISVPHRLGKDTDDEYRGWRIPSGSVVIANSWGVMHDAGLYPSPFEFLPERYLLDSNTSSSDQMNPDPRKFAFGYGRRVCPGQLLIDDTIYIAVVTILALFDIGPLESEEPRYTPNIISHPGPFACNITPRSR